MSSLISRIAAAPRAHSPERGETAAARMGAAGPYAELLSGAAGSSRYLDRLIEREADWLSEAARAAPEAAFAELIAALLDEDGPAMATLRRVKRRAALLIALADLGDVWDLTAVTDALSDLADHAVRRAFDVALSEERTGPLAGRSAAEAGLIILAMGKGGARELNYSSDVDLILLFDDERLGDVGEVRPRWIKVAQRAVKLLSAQTADGYVFRVDLRLRPNPSVTPLCMPLSAAERYYESVGRTWERAAFIKARAVGGDLAAGQTFLEGLAPFVWRRHLDFAAIEDINDIRAKIRDAKGLGGVRDLPGYDLKLGPGGIREIEFFAQTQQLALGGRIRALRAPATRDALAALTAAGRLEAEDCDALTNAYVNHRRLEHRLQMLEDAQTHAIPVSVETRDMAAALGGWPHRGAMEAEVAARLSDVRARVTRFFAPASPPEEVAAPDPEALGFARPETIETMADRWVLGGIAATRDQRARRKVRALTPYILGKLAGAANPDEAALQFDRFLTGLPAGVQLFSLFEANPQLLDLLVEICAAAPRLAEYLSRNAAVFDAVLDADFFQPLQGRDDLADELTARLAEAGDYEDVLNAARRWAKEKWFRLGVQVLRGVADGAEAGRGFTAIAEACLVALTPIVEAAFAARHGPAPGRGAAVIAMGKLGSREMTASSDLDLIVIYDPEGAAESDGPKPLATPVYFARLTQMLMNALTAPTAEGTLYEVDMRLRPSGGQGPVAIALSRFAAYHREEAWTWEQMALTRARVVAGAPSLRAELTEIIREVLSAPRDPDKTRADVAEMRGRLEAAHAAERDQLWALKHARGGMMDIEFAAQCGLLSASLPGPFAPDKACAALSGEGMASDDASVLIGAYRLQSHLQHVERIAHAGAFRADEAGEGLKAALARAGWAADFSALEAALAERREAAAVIVDRLLKTE